MRREENVSEKRVSPEALRKMLARFEPSSVTGSTFYFLPANNETKPDLPGSLWLPETARAKILKSSTGSVIFYTRQNTGSEYTLVIPPFPVQKSLVASYMEITPLLEILEREFVIGIVLIRLGSFAFGVSRGQKLITSKVGTGLVHGRHRQGGSSANRFARHREKQMETFFTRACSYLREYFAPHVKEIDYMLYGGARNTIQEFRKQCSFANTLQKPELPSLLDIPDPRLAVLHKALERAWSSRVFTWVEPDTG